MLTIKGIQSGAVLQRDENNFCSVMLTAAFNGIPSCSLGELKTTDREHWRLTGIPVGGPYTLTIRDAVDCVTFHTIYVGDLWLLAGQSNMEGAGRMTPEDARYAADPLPFLRAFYMDDTWNPAKPVLHQLYLSADSPHRDTWNRNMENLQERGVTNPVYPYRGGVGPGLYFAQEMFRLTDGVPQGLIPTAVGGAPISMWLPTSDGTQNYYTAACRRIEETGSHIRGVFWAQGEGNSNAADYPAQIEQIRNDLCERLSVKKIPFVQLQSFKCTLSFTAENDLTWSRFREMQRNMPMQASGLATVATNDLELDDCVHLSSDSQKIAGVRGARAMDHLLVGRGLSEPRLDRVYAVEDGDVPALFSEVHIRYAHIAGDLQAKGVPFGFMLQKKDTQSAPSIQMFRKIELHQNEVVLKLEIPLPQLAEYVLWYGYGNAFYCNITDQGGRAIPSMGPIPISIESRTASREEKENAIWND